MTVRGGIYIEKNTFAHEAEEFALCVGEEIYLWFGTNEVIKDLYMSVEHGGANSIQIIEGYSFGINKQKQEWRVRDTGHKQGKHILWQGHYTSKHVEKQIERLFSRLFY